MPLIKLINHWSNYARIPILYVPDVWNTHRCQIQSLVVAAWCCSEMELWLFAHSQELQNEAGYWYYVSNIFSTFYFLDGDKSFMKQIKQGFLPEFTLQFISGREERQSMTAVDRTVLLLSKRSHTAFVRWITKETEVHPLQYFSSGKRLPNKIKSHVMYQFHDTSTRKFLRFFQFLSFVNFSELFQQ